MSLQALPSGAFKVRWRHGARHMSKTFPVALEPNPRKRRKLAEDYLRERKREVALGLPQLVGRLTLRDVAHEFIDKTVAQKSPKTQALYKSLWNAHISKLGGYPIAQITPGMIEDWVNAEWRIKRGEGIVTKRKALVLLGQIFKFAMRRRYALSNPVALVEPPKPPAPEPVHPPTPLEVERIRKAFLDAELYREATLASVIAYAGLRPLSEALALTRADVRDKTLLVRAPKTNSFRTATLLAPLAEDLDWWMSRNPAFPKAPLFPNHKGEHWTTTQYDNWRKRVWGDYADVTPKALRHLFVSLLLRDESFSRRDVADQAGHSLEVQDRVYSHVFDELRGTGSAEGAIREARAEVFGSSNPAAEAGEARG